MPDKDYILARIMLRAAVPLVKVLIEDDPKMREKYRGFNKIVQFEVKGSDDLVTQLKFEDGIPKTIVRAWPKSRSCLYLQERQAAQRLFCGQSRPFRRLRG